MVEYINNTVHEQDYMQHLRDEWNNGVANAVDTYMSEFLEESLDKISSFLQVSLDLAHVNHAFYKEFSLTTNYTPHTTMRNSKSG